MNVTGLIYFVILALVISAIFSFGFRRRGPWGSFWIFFIILFLAIWATDLWLRPAAGPNWGEIYWLPPLAIGIIIALILAAATPAPRNTAEELPENKNPVPEDPGYIALGIFFWAFLIILIAAVLFGLFTGV
ncbi:MAG TPA: hypothetical protein VE870_17305 [Bacteroidales bacterium]|nr:hypothetical protein [Bacteroidales bacterium]